MNFTNDEINLICIYNTGNRQETIKTLAAMREFLHEDETELLALTDSAVEKLHQITDEEYNELDLFPDFDEE